MNLSEVQLEIIRTTVQNSLDQLPAEIRNEAQQVIAQVEDERIHVGEKAHGGYQGITGHVGGLEAAEVEVAHISW